MHGNSTFTREVADKILERLADGETLRAICRTEGMPPESTVRNWAMDDVDGFAAQYTRAREIGYHSMADELMEIADTTELGEKKKISEDGKVEVTQGDMIEHRRLKVDTRKWLLSKALPKVYGDKLDVNHAGLTVNLGADAKKA